MVPFALGSWGFQQREKGGLWLECKVERQMCPPQYPLPTPCLRSETQLGAPTLARCKQMPPSVSTRATGAWPAESS